MVGLQKKKSNYNQRLVGRSHGIRPSFGGAALPWLEAYQAANIEDFLG